MKGPSFLLYENFQRLLDHQYNSSTIAILEDFICLLFHNKVLSKSALQNIGNKTKQLENSKENLYLRPPNEYYLAKLPEEWLRAAFDTFQDEFRHFKRFTSGFITDPTNFQRLKYPAWLNDEILEEYCWLISTACSNAYITNSFALENPSINLKKFINRDNYLILLTGIAIIPINIRNVHWTFACVWLTSETELLIEYYDSNLDSNPSWESLPSVLQTWIQRTFPPTVERKIWEGRSPQQRNSSDCGLFVLMGIRMRAMGWSVFSQEEADKFMPEARHRVFAEILAGHLDPSLEDMKIYNSIVSGEVKFPDLHETHSVNYVIERDSAGNEFINLDSPETELFTIDGKNDEVEDTHYQFTLRSMEPAAERDLIENSDQSAFDSMGINGARDLIGNLHEFKLDSMEANDGDNLLGDTIGHVTEDPYSTNCLSLARATDQENSELMTESQNQELNMELNSDARAESKLSVGLGNEFCSISKLETREIASGELFLNESEEHESQDSIKDMGGKTVAVQEVIPENVAQNNFLSSTHAGFKKNSSRNRSQDDGQHGDVGTRIKRQRNEGSDLNKALLAADKFASPDALIENLRTAIIAYRGRTRQEQHQRTSLASLWSNIRPEEHNPQTIFQRYTRLNFARRWFEVKARLPQNPREQISQMKKMLNLKGNYEEQHKEFKAANTYANRCLFWVELIGKLSFLTDGCHEVIMCACGESTTELERMKKDHREKYFERILFRIRQEPNDITEKIRASAPLYRALIENNLPDHQLVLEGNRQFDSMSFAELVSLDPARGRWRFSNTIPSPGKK
ncbi:uncharacterized protein EAF02_007322 [Botrytis sinoallii]|uniref:uncharacterized protein n=1 Tax=Botrytis sinoallii TaxID=1463999 RepID=UPI0018FFE8DF|nr:uncharacterized protein EAF02_007322 [Botrytis sinoallii]KAF7880476.1 hypothetical protein EAF02_007322 [Botrytis sinoallii]